MDPHKLRLSQNGHTLKHWKVPRHKPGERFLRGPIPMSWVNAAARATGKGSGFKVAIAIWHISGIHHQAKTITLSGKVLREMGVERHAGYRGLKQLESAGLVTVDRHSGRLPIVTILDITESGNGA